MWTRRLLAGLILAASAFTVRAQGYVDQEAVASLLESQGSGALTEKVTWHHYNIGRNGKNTKAMLAKLQAHLDSLPGAQWEYRMAIVELTNRVSRKYMMQKGTLLVPDHFPADFRAYAPYPAEYAGAAELPKLFVIDKYTQTFGAYEHGRLVRWGLVSTGRENDLTPAGRYSFNWKDEYRESTAAPEGEVWKLRWVFNFHAAEGIHVHQYQLPIATPASHGCVRLSEADAMWNYSWADGWKKQNGKLVSNGTTVLVLNYNPVGLAAHWTQEGHSLVMLPEDPMDVPLGAGAAKEVVASK